MTKQESQPTHPSSDVLSPVGRLLRRRTSELDAIRDIFRAVNASSDLRSILDSITQTTTRALRADSSSIYLLDSAAKRLVSKRPPAYIPTRSITRLWSWAKA